MAKGIGAPQELVAEIEALAGPLLRGYGLELVDLEFRRQGRRGLLRVFIDKPGGVGIEDCRRLSEELGDLLDVSDLVAESYDLEVSSPGLDRELKKERELRWAVGKRVRLWTAEAIEGCREFAGRLAAVAEEALTVEEGARRWAVPRALLAKARLEEVPGPERTPRQR